MARATCGGCSWARARNLAQLRRADRSGVSTAPVGLHDRRVARNLAHMQQDLRQRRARAHFYGGDVQGKKAAAHMQEAVCLHKSTNKAVRAISDTIITGTYTCSLEAAESMVEQGQATPEDFWLLFGYAGWAAGQLQMEIDKRASWHVAAASPVLLHELVLRLALQRLPTQEWKCGKLVKVREVVRQCPGDFALPAGRSLPAGRAPRFGWRTSNSIPSLWQREGLVLTGGPAGERQIPKRCSTVTIQF
jgi:hypothetical protein